MQKIMNDDFTQNSSTDIKRYISKLISHWYWFVISFVVIMGIVFLFNPERQQ